MLDAASLDPALALLAPLQSAAGAAGAALLPWLAALAVLAASAAALGVWSVARRLDRLQSAAQRLDALEQIRTSLDTLGKERSDLDWRRIEHVLIEMRDGQRRLEDSILRATQSALAAASAADGSRELQAAPGDPAGRVVARVLAEGFERVQLVPSGAELAALLATAGPHEVLVEARRNGVLCKGRVLLRDGAVTDIALTPAYTMFP